MGDHEWLDAEDLAFLRECCYNDRPMVMRLLSDLDAARALLGECADGLFFSTDEPKWKLLKRIRAIPGVTEEKHNG